MSLQALLTVWSIRGALVLLGVALVVRCAIRRRDLAGRGGSAVRVIWVLGCLLAILHVIGVFGYLMHWSHQAALDDTGMKTEQLIGVRFEGGVYFNYLFLLLWGLDAAWWCLLPEVYLQRARLWEVSLIGYLWFIAFNATVVFESGPVRWAGVLVTLLMIAVGIRTILKSEGER